ncbi:hypothetical protein P8C59_004715 [Phyllachora maydis]|uniref:Target of rapamycin complex subunit LST8 n=1 Tax=Phyllachora maydis TaxID=1825666 RepID=A0AAD9MEQ8_9PEZI|nr:hypothetical protein P8C59_004715 [Phyllachora maydis]
MAMSVILATAGYDHTIRFWEALSGVCARTIQHPDSQVNRLCISPDKRFLAAAGHHTVKLFDIRSTNPQPVMVFDRHTNNVTGVQFHCEGKWMVTSSEDCTVKIWDTQTGRVQRSYNHGSPVNDVIIHPNQGELITCDRAGSIRLWDLAEGTCSHQLIPEEDVSVTSVTISSEATMLCAANTAGSVYVWRLINVYERTQLATCSADHTAKVWTVDPEMEPPPPPSPDARGNTTEDDENPLELEANLVSHQRWVWDCAFSADSAYLVTASSDHYARLWELHSQAIIRQYNGHHRGAVCVALNDYSEPGR